jgi:hypothetical protein
MLSKKGLRSPTNGDSCLEGGRRVGGRIEINGGSFSGAEIAAVANYVTSHVGSNVGRGASGRYTGEHNSFLVTEQRRYLNGRPCGGPKLLGPLPELKKSAAKRMFNGFGLRVTCALSVSPREIRQDWTALSRRGIE